MGNANVHGLRLELLVPIDWAYLGQIARNKKLREVRAALKALGIEKSEYKITLSQGPHNPKLRSIRGGK